MSGSTHFIGIGGTGLSAIARVLLERGERVSGSDRMLSPQALALKKMGAIIVEGHQAKNVNGAQLVIRSSAIPEENVEVQRAIERGIPVLKRSEALGSILEGKRILAVAGSHGKTTTSALLTWLLISLGLEPGFIVGSDLNNTGSNAAAGSIDEFVIEADEYDYMFLGLEPHIALLTNVEHDHPDMFAKAEDFFSAFRSFVDRIEEKGKLLYCQDDAGAKEIAEFAIASGKQAISYGIRSDQADYKGLNIRAVPGAGSRFDFVGGSARNVPLEISLAGWHNVQNAVGALAVIDQLGYEPAKCAEGLKSFKGTGRRFQITGEINDIVFVDDYAHHPSEITATIQAAKDRYVGRRLMVVWQPHTYSRTEMLWQEFIESLKAADRVFVTPVFAAREEIPSGFELTSKLASIGEDQFTACSDLDACAGELLKEIREGDVVLVLSAGDATEINQRVLDQLQEAI